MTIGDFVLINAFMMQLFCRSIFLGLFIGKSKAPWLILRKCLYCWRKPQSARCRGAKLVISNGEIQFGHVYFQYRDDRPILKGVSFLR